MDQSSNPALAAFLASFAEEREWAEVLIRRTSSSGFELCHRADRGLETLRATALGELRKLSLFTGAGQFRPLKAAPDLVRGWRFVCRGEQDLWRAIQELYPGSIPDWHAVSAGAAVTTDYRAFTQRQTGMYRITQLLSDPQAAQVIAACCPAHFCLKQRLWSVPGLAQDAAPTKSAIPCLEPCAVFLELARKESRIEQEEKQTVAMPPTDLETLRAAVQYTLEHRPADTRTGDIAAALNPRRLQLLLEKYRTGRPTKAAE